jgi:hypothetical protein
MGDSESEKLCARLTGSVANKSANEFYQEFNLQKGTVFSEFYFKEMMQIYHFPGMELWPKVITSGLGNNQKADPHHRSTCPWFALSPLVPLHPNHQHQLKRGSS